MKYLILYLLFFSNFSFSQIEIYNLGLTDTTQKVMYNRHKNEFKVYGIVIDSTFTLMHGSDTLKYFYGKFFLNRFHSESDSLVLYKSNEVLLISFFKQKGIPILKYYLGDIRDSMITKSELIYALNNGGVHATYEPKIALCDRYVIGFDDVYIKKENGKIIRLYKRNEDNKKDRYYDKIFSWSDSKMERKYKNGWSNKYLNRMNTLKNNQMRKVKKMKNGDVLYIPRIISTCPSCISVIQTVDLKFIVN